VKSTSRMLGGFKAQDTLRENRLRLKALDYFRKLAITSGRGLPSISHCKKPDIHHTRAGWYLTMNYREGYKELRFGTWAELGDWLIRLAPHC